MSISGGSPALDDPVVPPEARSPRFGARDTYLASARATLTCAREFDRLSGDVEELAEALTEGLPEGDTKAKADVRRAPGRCIVQLGPVALTISWLQSRADTVAEGRLLVIEWDGIVGPGPTRSPERSELVRSSATLIREDVFSADATVDSDWKWRAADGAGYQSKQLAAKCVDALDARFRRVS